MAQPSYRTDTFQQKTHGHQTSNKVRLTNGDINMWLKKVKKPSEFAVSEAISTQKPHTGRASCVVALQSMDQLQDHDDAYNSAEAILSDWMNKKLHLDLEMNKEPKQQTEEQPGNLNYTNFNDMYSRLAPEDESVEVCHILQDLMETDLMACDTVQELWMDMDDEKKRGCDPKVTMEIRHRQVKERRAQRDAEQQRQRKEQEAWREVMEEARRLERDKQKRRKQEAQRQQELLQQETVRLRKEMQEKKSIVQMTRKWEQEMLEKQNTMKNSIKPISDVVIQRQLCHKQQEMETKVHIINLKCMQTHFTAWYTVVLEKRMRLGKAVALCDWRSQLRAWRAWRALVWETRKEREAERTEEELRLENRHCQLAEKNNRRRLLKRCLSNWRFWCHSERERKELLHHQEKTREKMAALINAAASGKLSTYNCTKTAVTVHAESMNQSESATQLDQVPIQSTTSASPPPTLTGRRAVRPTQAWLVTQQDAVPSLAEAQYGWRQRSATHCQSTEMSSGQLEHRHLVQQKTIAEQERLLKEQHDIISELYKKQKLLELRQQEEIVEQQAFKVKPSTSQRVTKTSHKSKGTTGDSSISLPAPKGCNGRLASPHPTLRAMEERAQQRAERRREVKELKRRQEEEKLAEMKAEEEERVRQEEEEKRKAAERRREKKQRELEKQRRIKLEQKLFKQAEEHYHRSQLLYRGMIPWKQLKRQSHTNTEKAVAHQTQVLQRHYFLFWLHTTTEALEEKRNRADQLYKCILLRQTLYNWITFRHLQSQQMVQAEHFYITQIQRKVFKALSDHTIHQKLEARDREWQANKHRARCVLIKCFAAWQHLPEIQQEERARNERREKLRLKVAEVLPDFQSSPLESIWGLSSHTTEIRQQGVRLNNTYNK